MKKFSILSVFLFLIMCVNNVYAQEDIRKEFADAILADNHELIRQLVGLDSGLMDTTLYTKGFLSSASMNMFHIALRDSDTTTIDLLLDLGANPNLKSIFGAIMRSTYKTSLEILSQRGDVEIMEKYIDRLEISHASYAAALEKAADDQNQEMIDYLLSKGKEILIDSSNEDKR